MDRKKRFAMSAGGVAITFLLVGSLLIALPGATAEKTTATAAGGVNALSTSSFQFSFDMKVTNAGDVPDHIPTEFAFVDVKRSDSSVACLATSAAVGGLAKVAISKTGGKATRSYFPVGYGSGLDDDYLFDATSLKTGVGPGQYTFKLTVTNCDIFPAAGGPAQAKFTISGGIGESKGPLKHVVIKEKQFTLSNTAFKPAAADATTAVVGSDSDESGDETTILLGDKDKAKGRALAAGSTFSESMSGSSKVSKVAGQIKTEIATSNKALDDNDDRVNGIPSGTSISVTTRSEGTRNDPAFDQDSDSLKDETDQDPKMSIRIDVNVPGKEDSDAADYFDFLDVTIKLPKSEFATGEEDLFKLVGFKADGTRKDSDPVRQGAPTSVGSNWQWVFRITDFSSFAGVVAPVTTLTGDFDNTDGSTVIRIGDVNKITWTSCGSGTEGYQVWRQAGSSWVFRGETAPDVLSWNDAGAAASAVYKITCFEGHSLAEGWIDTDGGADPDDIPGWEDGTTVDSEGVTSNQASANNGWPWGGVVAIVVLICGALVVVVFALVRVARS